MIQIKNAKELDGMRKANALSAAALKYGGEHIEAGMTTWELDKLIYDFIVKHGGTPNFKGLYGFPGTACISLNDTIIHGIPSHDIVIRPGDIVSIDTGAKVDGFNGDNACTYAVGKIDLEAQRLLDVTKASHGNGIGVGLFDVITKQVAEQLDLESMYANAIAGNFLCDVVIPCTVEDEATAIRVALKCCRGIDRDNPKIIRIQNTLHLEYIEVSEALLADVEANPRLSLVD